MEVGESEWPSLVFTLPATALSPLGSEVKSHLSDYPLSHPPLCVQSFVISPWWINENTPRPDKAQLRGSSLQTRKLGLNFLKALEKGEPEPSLLTIPDQGSFTCQRGRTVQHVHSRDPSGACIGEEGVRGLWGPEAHMSPTASQPVGLRKAAHVPCGRSQAWMLCLASSSSGPIGNINNLLLWLIQPGSLGAELDSPAGNPHPHPHPQKFQHYQGSRPWLSFA